MNYPVLDAKATGARIRKLRLERGATVTFSNHLFYQYIDGGVKNNA